MPAEIDVPTSRRLAGIRLVLMDIDGTLVLGQEETIENVTRQLRRLVARGLRFTLATGRTLHGAASITRNLLKLGSTMPPMIAYNGAVIARPDETVMVRRQAIPDVIVHRLLEATESLDVKVLVYTCQPRLDASPVERVFSDVRHRPSSESEPNGMAIEVLSDLMKMDAADVTAMLVDCGDGGRLAVSELAKVFRVKLGDTVRITSSGTRFVEIAAQGVSKLAAMRTLADIWGIRVEEILAIGDSFNDMEMIGGAGVGAAVANAPIEVKSVAAVVASRPASEGVVEILRLLVSELRDLRMQGRASSNG